MEPAFQRGDILMLTNYDTPIRVGEIVVFKIKDRDIPIVHRVLQVHEKPNGQVFWSFIAGSIYRWYQIELLTKGDNNRVDDRGLYAPGQMWLNREDILGIRTLKQQFVFIVYIVGRAQFVLRYLGMVTIMLNDYPILKYVLIGIMGLFVLTNKEG